MFEKEAEEYGEKDLGDKYLSSVVAKDKLHAYKLGQYDGFIAGAEFGYNKANEWHYVKDEGTPKDSGAKLCYTRTAKYVCATYDEKYDCWGFVFNNLEHCIPSSVVIKWKEIVLPELKENE